MTQCGSLGEKGQFFGYGPADTTHQVKVFHIEGFWGERWDRLAGLVYDMGEWKAKMTAEGGGYNFTGAGYTAARGCGKFRRLAARHVSVRTRSLTDRTGHGKRDDLRVRLYLA